MNKFKVTKIVTIKKEKYKCAVCDKKLYSKIPAYKLESESGFVSRAGGPGYYTRAVVCSELCVNTYIFQHIDDPVYDKIGSFDKFVFPMIRAVWPNLIAQQLVNVQPISTKLGTIFMKKTKKGTKKK